MRCAAGSCYGCVRACARRQTVQQLEKLEPNARHAPVQAGRRAGSSKFISEAKPEYSSSSLKFSKARDHTIIGMQSLTQHLEQQNNSTPIEAEHPPERTPAMRAKFCDEQMQFKLPQELVDAVADISRRRMMSRSRILPPSSAREVGA